MISPQTATVIINSITFALAYFVINTLAGAFRAWVADKVGDDTAKEMGFTSLNPAVHADFFGMIALFLFKFGWGKYVPINPFNITGRWRWLKFVVAYFSDVVLRLAIALAIITALTIFFGFKTAHTTIQMLACEAFSPYYLTTACPTLSSSAVTIAYVMMAFAYLSVIFAVLYFINNGLNVIFFAIISQDKNPYLVEERYRSSHYWVLFVTLLIIIFFSHAIRMRLLYCLLYIAAYVAQMMGQIL